jgi:hypothetical protein
MPVMLLLSSLLVASPALAGVAADTDSAASSSDATDSAEYKRLREELDRLAKRNAWTGVERTFQLMVETGVTPTFDDYKVAAHAAQNLGSIQDARDRLRAATMLREDKEVLDWLWSIDSSYGKVFLAGDPGEYALLIETPPFDPTQARALQFAVDAVERTGTFEGLLPKGTYLFGPHKIEVRPQVSQVRVDVRSESGVRKSKKAEKRAGDPAG